MILLDANAVLRYLLNDIPEQAEKVNTIINNNVVYITTEVMAEIVYVLKGVYKVEKEIISNKLIEFIEIPNVNTMNIELLKTALDYFSNKKLDFVDCILASYKKVQSYDIFTFDKDLNSLLNDLNLIS